MADWTTDDIPDQTGRTALITGANSGIGLDAAKALADAGAHVVLACRSIAKAETAVSEIEADAPPGTTEIVEIDLADLESVEQGAHEFLNGHDRLDLLINNAGLMAIPKRLTRQGVEMQFGVNHLAHYALTGHLLDALHGAGSVEVPARVVTVSSQAHRAGSIDVDHLDASASYNPWAAYSASKLANLLFTREFDGRCREAGLPVIGVAAHPGASSTNLGNEPAGDLLSSLLRLTRPIFENFIAQSSAMGALPTLRAATDPDVDGGDYFGPRGFNEMRGYPVRVEPSRRAQDDDLAAELWDVSRELSGVDYL